MKLRQAAVAILAITALSASSYAQNLFRVGRPEYSRPPSMNHDHYSNLAVPPQNWARPIANRSDFRRPTSQENSWAYPADQRDLIDQNRMKLAEQRLAAARQRYRLEADRYRSLYGSDRALSESPAITSYRRIPTRKDSSVAPVGYYEEISSATANNRRLPDSSSNCRRHRRRVDSSFSEQEFDEGYQDRFRQTGPLSGPTYRSLENYRPVETYSPAGETYRPVEAPGNEWSSNRSWDAPKLNRAELSRTASNSWQNFFSSFLRP